MTEPEAFQLKAIDSEHDIRPDVVIVRDYNGDPVVHVFVTGQRVLVLTREGDVTEGDAWRIDLPQPRNTEERSAIVTLYDHLGEWNEWQVQSYNARVGLHDEAAVFEAISEVPAADGHAVTAWIDEVLSRLRKEL